MAFGLLELMCSLKLRKPFMHSLAGARRIARYCMATRESLHMFHSSFTAPNEYGYCLRFARITIHITRGGSAIGEL